jgi:hypothetical protein
MAATGKTWPGGLCPACARFLPADPRWNQGIRITGVQQSIGEIAEDNDRSAPELLNLLVPLEPSSPLLID